MGKIYPLDNYKYIDEYSENKYSEIKWHTVYNIPIYHLNNVYTH